MSLDGLDADLQAVANFPIRFSVDNQLEDVAFPRGEAASGGLAGRGRADVAADDDLGGLGAEVHVAALDAAQRDGDLAGGAVLQQVTTRAGAERLLQEAL